MAVIPGVKFSQFPAGGDCIAPDKLVGIRGNANESFDAPSALTKQITQAAHGFILGAILKMSLLNTYQLAQANSIANSDRVVGFVRAIIDANNFVIQFGGYATIPGLAVPLVPATMYFLSDLFPGLVTAIEPVAPGTVSKPLLVAYSPTSFYWLNQLGIVN